MNIPVYFPIRGCAARCDRVFLEILKRDSVEHKQSFSEYYECKKEDKLVDKCTSKLLGE